MGQQSNTLMLAVGGIVVAVVATLGVIIMAGQSAMQNQSCRGVTTAAGGPSAAAATGEGPGPGGLSRAQLRNAAIIWRVGKQAGVPDRGVVVALATATQESDLRNLDGGDRDSLGLFQQRPSTGWGAPRQITSPTRSAAAFYGVAGHTGNTGLLDIPGWQSMPVTVAAQAVQRSAFPTAYADDADLAQALVARFSKTNPAAGKRAGTVNAAADCGMLATGTGPGGIQFPLPRSAGAINQDNFGGSGSQWSSSHTGNDFSVSCGTPVRAVHGGTVRIRRDQPWAGPWLVQIATGENALTTWYAHMQAIAVTDGQRVTGGQRLGQVGTLGNSTGCHLHLEVHPSGGSIYQDPVDPTAWLRDHLSGGTR